MRPALALAAALLALPAAAQDVPTLDADGVKSWTSGGFDALVVDARTPGEYAEGHLPGAVNLPPERVVPEAARLPRSKAAVLIFYCRGPG